jgi:hypothetical protein
VGEVSSLESNVLAAQRRNRLAVGVSPRLMDALNCKPRSGDIEPDALSPLRGFSLSREPPVGLRPRLSPAAAARL